MTVDQSASVGSHASDDLPLDRAGMGEDRGAEQAPRAGRTVSTSTVYLLLAIPMAAFFLLSIPPSQGLDESAHWFRVWQLSEGHVIAGRTTLADGTTEVNADTYPVCVREFVDHYQTLAATPEPFDWGSYWSTSSSCDEDVTVTGEAMGTYSIWSYPGQTVGVAIGRALHLPIPVVFYLGRLVGAGLSIGMCWYAISRAPRGRLALAFIALLPMAVMSSVVYSPDGVMLGGSLILASAALRFRAAVERMPWTDLIVPTVALAAVALSKPPYILLGLPLLAIRTNDPQATAEARRRVAAAFGVVALVTVLWHRFGVTPEAVDVYRPGANEGRQLSWILEHPIAYANTLWDTFFGWESQSFVVQGWVGAFGMMRSGSADSPLIAPAYVVVAAIALAMFCMAERGPRITFASRSDRALSWAAHVTIPLQVLAVYTAAYLSWSDVAAPLVWGVQGRYLVPVLPLLPTAIGFRHERPDLQPRHTTMVVFVGILFAGAVLKIATYFY